MAITIGKKGGRTGNKIGKMTTKTDPKDSKACSESVMTAKKLILRILSAGRARGEGSTENGIASTFTNHTSANHEKRIHNCRSEFMVMAFRLSERMLMHRDRLKCRNSIMTISWIRQGAQRLYHFDVFVGTVGWRVSLHCITHELVQFTSQL